MMKTLFAAILILASAPAFAQQRIVRDQISYEDYARIRSLPHLVTVGSFHVVEPGKTFGDGNHYVRKGGYSALGRFQGHRSFACARDAILQVFQHAVTQFNYEWAEIKKPVRDFGLVSWDDDDTVSLVNDPSNPSVRFDFVGYATDFHGMRHKFTGNVGVQYLNDVPKGLSQCIAADDLGISLEDEGGKAFPWNTLY